ncbi:MAG: hypothetical protein B7Y76_10525 [Sphingobacteriia bacterium 35-40-5]|nr:MAG: hypothetical protein B7Y76_10525 [Sphingobacteriia bacterium 35-40-5]
MKDKSNSSKIFKARTIGFFFLLAFLAYGFGRYLVESTNNSEKYIGALLIIANSVMVLFIGILFRKTLKQYNSLVGNIYLYTRVFEALALASLVLTLFLKGNISDDLGYFLAMLVLGLGSIPMCLTLHKHKISPPWLAIWGAIGYTIFSFGFLMELFGKEWSMYLLGISGLWEITFASWLIIYGRQSVKTTNR